MRQRRQDDLDGGRLVIQADMCSARNDAQVARPCRWRGGNCTRIPPATIWIGYRIDIRETLLERYERLMSSLRRNLTPLGRSRVSTRDRCAAALRFRGRYFFVRDAGAKDESQPSADIYFR